MSGLRIERVGACLHVMHPDGHEHYWTGSADELRRRADAVRWQADSLDAAARFAELEEGARRELGPRLLDAAVAVRTIAAGCVARTAQQALTLAGSEARVVSERGPELAVGDDWRSPLRAVCTCAHHLRRHPDRGACEQCDTCGAFEATP